jgi:uncharacterized protein DUF4157
MSGAVDAGLRSPGQPLDQATRAILEPSFGRDFGHVRVHADAQAAESARAVDALAYTAGQDVVFAAGRYRPESAAGRALIAHELTHTIQQQAAPSETTSESDGLELEANRAAVDVLAGRPAHVTSAAAAPAVQYLKVTQGGFGRALEEFTNMWSVPDSTIRLLWTSPTFMRLARTIDQHFVAREDSFRFNPESTPTGTIARGDAGMPRSMIGKRELMVIRHEPAFEPVNSPDNPLSADLIQVDDLDPAGFIQQLGHEATHAATFVGATAPSPQTLVDEVNAGIQEEIATRRSEATILGEVNDPQVRAQVAKVGSRVTTEVERDIAPALGMTYLESFFFDRRLRDAQASDQITEDSAREYREVISKAISLGLAVPDFYGEYGRVWVDRQTCVKEWADFHRSTPPGSPGYDAAKEVLLQDHATRFFGGQVSYQPLAAPAPAATVP